MNNAAMYFGPYPSGLAAKETLRFVQQVFPLRSCRNRDLSCGQGRVWNIRLAVVLLLARD